MLHPAQPLAEIEAAMLTGARVRLRLNDGRGSARSARIFVGVPSSVGPWGATGETHVVIQMLGAHGTMVAVAVQLDRVLAVERLEESLPPAGR